jgi:hypothetical protein
MQTYQTLGPLLLCALSCACAATSLDAPAARTAAVHARIEAPFVGTQEAAESPVGGGSDAADLARQLSNPVASLISVPFQLNYDHDIGPGDDGERYALNVQPVIPITLNEDWNAISRTIVPLLYQDDIPPGEDELGIGDVLQSVFFSPKEPTEAGWIWGVGPALLIPTATDDTLGQEQLAIGPTAVVLTQRGPWTYGALANQLWKIAGDDDRADINAAFLQPFLSYTTPDAWTYTANSESTYDWNEDELAIPINLLVTRVLRLGDQLVSVGGGVRYWLEESDGGPEGFGLRLIVTLLYPKG